MRRGVSVVLALAAVLAFGSGAAAASHPQGSQVRVARLSKQVRHLRAQLRHVTLARSKQRAAIGALRASLEASQAQLQTANEENASLQQLLAQRTSERDSALNEVTSLQGQVSTLQAQIAAVPTALAVAEEQVRREVRWAETELDLFGIPYSHGQLVAVSAMNYVVGHVSTGAYGYLELYGGTLPPATPDAVLGAQAGICGHAALTFAAIVKHFGYAVRSVQFYYATPDGTPDSHIAGEVHYDGGWHFFGPTFGIYWTDRAGKAMSITDVRSDGGTPHKDAGSFTNVVEDPWFNGDDTAFMTDPVTRIDLEKQPFDA